jgi:hypothetical protein
MRLLPPFAPLFLVSLSLGCGGTTTLARYAASNDAPGIDALLPGKKVSLNASAGQCASTLSSDDPDVVLGGNGAPIGGLPWASGSVWTIRDSRVSRSNQTVALQLTSDDGKETHWVRLPAAGESCVYPVDSAQVAGFSARIGKKLVFAPWMRTCSAIEAAGPSAQALLFDSDPGSSLPVTAVTVAPASTLRAATPVPWMVFAKGAVRVRADVVDTCFAAEGTEDATPPSGVRDLLRSTKAQCPNDMVEGKTHVACRSSVGVWEGVVNDSTVSLQMVRRTLGPVHFVGGKPMSREAFARAVVAVSFGAAPTAREQALYDSLRGAVAAGLAGQGGLVRATTAGDTSATMELYIGASQLTIGDLQTAETSDQTTYKDHQETHPNPKKADLRKAVGDSDRQINNAQSEIQRAQQAVTDAEANRQKEEELKQEAINTCKDRANSISNPLARSAALMGCTGADIAVNPDGGVPEAQQALSEARNHLSEAQGRKASAEADLASTPDTVTEWVMMPWTYKKKVVSRTVSVQLETKVTPKGGAPNGQTQPVQLTLSDMQVDDDPAHNVAGHAPNPDIVRTPDNLVPQIAAKLAEMLGGRLHQILTEEQQSAALRLFAEAGGEPAREEYRKVDAVAFEAVGPRLKKATRRGSGTATAVGLSLPASLVEIGAHGCMLAVAIASDPADGALKLATPSGSHADLRGASAALVEICADDGPPPDTITVTAKASTKVRWGLYLLGDAPK